VAFLKESEPDPFEHYDPSQVVRTEGDEVRQIDHKIKQYNYVKKIPEKPRQVRVQLGE
jgi:hypothetical protein